MKIYIGYDEREKRAYDVAVASASKYAVDVSPLELGRLAERGLLRRPVDRRGGKSYDLASCAWQSTDFAVSRFLVPIIHQSGWCLFTDCDVVFMADPNTLWSYADPSYAVMVVKHDHETGEFTKMDGQVQQLYNRKNWSSVMLFNCDHPAHKRLSLQDVQERPGRDLHQFYWLHDSEIGGLPLEWNWLVNVNPKPLAPGIAHFTLGGPWLPNWKIQPYDDLWYSFADRV